MTGKFAEKQSAAADTLPAELATCTRSVATLEPLWFVDAVTAFYEPKPNVGWHVQMIPVFYWINMEAR